MTTLVISGLWDIGRGSVDRPFTNYLEWFNILQQLECPIVLFTDESVRKQLTLRSDSITVIPCELSDLECYSLREQWLDIMRRSPHLPRYIEYTNVNYDIIIHSKLALMTRAIKEFKYDYYVWLDAGLLRPKETGIPHAPTGSWPDSSKIHLLDDNKLLVPWSAKLPTSKSEDQDKLLQDCLATPYREAVAGVLGGTAKAVETARELSHALLLRSLKKNLIGTEEHILSVACKYHPEHFHPHRVVREDVRLLPYQLGSDLPLDSPYPVCPNVQVLSVCTREMTVPAHFTQSTQRLGYQVKVIGRNDSWQGWRWRSQEYLKVIKRLPKDRTPIEVVILCDCTDVFFSGPAWEVYDKFKKDNQPLLINAEGQFSYLDRSGNSGVTREFFDQLAPPDCEMSRYPNAGIIIGTVQALTELLTEFIKYPDDQAAAMELLHQEYHLAIDYYGRYALSFPPEVYHRDKIKIEQGRLIYSTAHTSERPCVLHYPGRNVKRLNEHYIAINNFFSTASTGTTDSSSWPWWVWALIALGVVILLILLVLLIVYLSKDKTAST